MQLSKLKASAEKKVIAFGKGDSSKPLGKRKDIDDLAILAHQTGDRTLKDLFEHLPSQEELQAARTRAKLGGAAIPEKTNTATTAPVTAEAKSEAPAPAADTSKGKETNK